MAPHYRWTYLLLGIFAMLGFAPGIHFGLMLDLNRMYFPTCADSIGIPMLGLAFGLMVIVPILVVIGALITCGFGALPAPLWQWDRARPVRSWIVTLLLGLAFALFFLFWVVSNSVADLISPSSVVILYLLAATRAALLATRLDEA